MSRKHSITATLEEKLARLPLQAAMFLTTIVSPELGIPEGKSAFSLVTTNPRNLRSLLLATMFWGPDRRIKPSAQSNRPISRRLRSFPTRLTSSRWCSTASFSSSTHRCGSAAPARNSIIHGGRTFLRAPTKRNNSMITTTREVLEATSNLRGIFLRIDAME